MDNTPTGTREPEDEHLFRGRPAPRIRPDAVTPCVEGYFTMPAVWIGTEPDLSSVQELNPKVHYEVVIARKLSANIVAVALRDGTFLFDFMEWPLAPTITLPGYRMPGEGPCKVPDFHAKAEHRAESYSALRAQLLNVHQLCLMSAAMQINRASMCHWHPVTAWNTLRSAEFSAPSPHPDYQDPYSLLRVAVNNRFGVDPGSTCGRQVISERVVERSFELLDAVLRTEDEATVVILEAIFLAGCRSNEARYGEALVMAWAACEQMLNKGKRSFHDVVDLFTSRHVVV